MPCHNADIFPFNDVAIKRIAYFVIPDYLTFESMYKTVMDNPAPWQQPPWCLPCKLIRPMLTVVTAIMGGGPDFFEKLATPLESTRVFVTSLTFTPNIR